MPNRQYWYLVVSEDETFKRGKLLYGPYKNKACADSKYPLAVAYCEKYKDSHWFNYATVCFKRTQGTGVFESGETSL